MPKMPAWSYSSLTAFETCPRRYYLTRVTKQVVEPQTEATTHGNAAHKAFEISVEKKVPLPQGYEAWQPIVEKIQRVSAKRETELKIALNKDLKPVSWFDKSAWCRGIIDLNVENGTKALALDYKTGKRKAESTQLMLFAGLLMHAKPHIERVRTAYLWLKDRKIDSSVFNRHSLSEIWGEFVPRVQRMEAAYEKEKWQPQPSGLCKAWCPCTGCEFNGKRGG